MGTLVIVGLGLLAVEGLLSLRAGVRFLARARRAPGPGRRGGTGEAAGSDGDPGRGQGGDAARGEEPSVLLVVPCKGREPGLEDHLRSLLLQDWPRLEVRFVTADREDPAAPVIRTLVEENPGRATWLVAGRRPGCSEKAWNLVAAVRAGLDAEVLVTADSDGRADPGWLGRLLSGLPPAAGPPGAATGYRWYVPVGGPGGWLQSAWNAAALSAMSGDRPPFVWGGATAVRRTHLWATDVLDRWRRTASDDLSLTRALRAAGGSITFVPEALVLSPASGGPASVLRWIRRQMLLARVYAPALWAAVVGYQTAWTGLVAAGALVAPARPAAAALLAFVLAGSMVKGALRYAAARRLLAGRLEESPARTVAYSLLAPAFGPVTAACGLASLASRRVRWRGVTYELSGPERTIVVSRREEQAGSP